MTVENTPLLLVVACALLDEKGRILLAERPAGKTYAGLWEFPGGKMEVGETPEQTLVREVEEELGVKIATKNLVPFNFASYTHDNFHLLMPLYLCRHYKGHLHGREGQKLAWVEPQNLKNYPMPPADTPLIKALRQFLEHFPFE